MSLTNPDHVVTKQRLADFYQGILPYLGAPEVVRPTVYGIHITNSESDPDAKVQYIADAANMTPAHMDFTNDVFDYGSWSNAFFMPKPCMLKYDGTVDYYLDPSDYTKKVDGTASDVANTSYEGNAMMEWPKIWLKIVPEGTGGKSASIYISNENADGMFTDWNYHNASGQSKDHFYTAIYNGSLISNKLRSISGHQVMSNKTAQQEMDYAAANNPSGSYIWTTTTVTDMDLINFLLILMCKSTRVTSKYGLGLITGGTESINNSFRTGVHNTKGLFYGTNNGTASTYTNAVKVFGMENWWGFNFKRYSGEIIDNGTRKRKLTYGQEDGSTVTGYNVTGNGYVTSNVDNFSGTSGGYLKECIFTNQGMFPTVVGGTNTTYYCDKVSFLTNGVIVPFFSSASTSNDGAGPFFHGYNVIASNPSWAMGANLSARPLI